MAILQVLPPPEQEEIRADVQQEEDIYKAVETECNPDSSALSGGDVDRRCQFKPAHNAERHDQNCVGEWISETIRSCQSEPLE
jgi:hypothetical protein